MEMDALPPPTLPEPVPSAAPPPARGVGRPRDPRLDARVLDATRQLLVEVGYHHLSIEAVARRASVHRPVIYRRWRSKAELVHDAIYPPEDAILRVVDTGDFAADARTLVRNTILLFTRPEVRAAAPGMLAASRNDPAFRQALLPRYESSARRLFHRLMAGAVARGAASPKVDPDLLMDLMAGCVLFRASWSGIDDPRRFEDELLTIFLDAAGAVRPGRTPARRRPKTARATAPRQHKARKTAKAAKSTKSRRAG